MPAGFADPVPAPAAAPADTRPPAEIYAAQLAQMHDMGLDNDVRVSPIVHLRFPAALGHLQTAWMLPAGTPHVPWLLTLVCLWQVENIAALQATRGNVQFAIERIFTSRGM
jgi:hypothetical protein